MNPIPYYRPYSILWQPILSSGVSFLKRLGLHSVALDCDMLVIYSDKDQI